MLIMARNTWNRRCLYWGEINENRRCLYWGEIRGIDDVYNGEKYVE